MTFPQPFGPYTLHQLVGRGGMAEIYRATMPGIGSFEKVLAIKMILPHLVENEEYITMLTDEARLVVGLNHANIAQVYDLGRIADTYYIAMEYVHGVDIATIIKDAQRNQRHIPYEHVAYMMSGLCMGLHVAHHATDKNGDPLGIIHRDISPHNVLISFAGDVKVIDFGVAKASSKEGQTQVGVIKGKLLYMAPEQAMAKEIDGRADLFAAGLVMYKMLTWTLPFQGDNEFQIYNNILTKEIVPPRVLNPAVPEELNQICMTLLHRDVEQRYQDGYSAKKDLDRALHRIAPGYTPSRLSRYIEDNFLEMVQERLRRQNTQAGEAQSPRIREPVHAAAATAQAGGGNTPAMPAPSHAPAMQPQRTNMPGFGPTPTPGANMPGTPSGFHTPAPQTPAHGFSPSFPANDQAAFRTQGSQNFSTGGFDVPAFPPPDTALPQQKKRGIPLVFVAVIVLGILFVAMGTYVFFSDGASDTSTPPQEQTTTPPPATTTAPTEEPPLDPVNAEEPDPSIAAGELDMGTEADQSAESGPNIYQFDSEPAEAFCYLNGERLDKTPLNIEIAADDLPTKVTCKLEGFKDVVIELEQESDLTQRIVFEKLVEEKKPSTTPPASNKATKTPKPPRPTPPKEESTAGESGGKKSKSGIDLFDSDGKKGSKPPKQPKQEPSKETPENLDKVLEGW